MLAGVINKLVRWTDLRKHAHLRQPPDAHQAAAGHATYPPAQRHRPRVAAHRQIARLHCLTLLSPCTPTVLPSGELAPNLTRRWCKGREPWASHAALGTLVSIVSLRHIIAHAS